MEFVDWQLVCTCVIIIDWKYDAFLGLLGHLQIQTWIYEIGHPDLNFNHHHHKGFTASFKDEMIGQVNEIIWFFDSYNIRRL